MIAVLVHDKRKPMNPFPKGNRLWELRSSAGRKARFSSPEALWDACCEYFEWNEDHPLWKVKVFSYKGKHQHVPVAKMRAMSLGGLAVFLGINIRTWAKWRSRPDLGPVISRVESVIWRQKFEGAAAGLLKPQIIARDLGLTRAMKR